MEGRIDAAVEETLGVWAVLDLILVTIGVPLADIFGVVDEDPVEEGPVNDGSNGNGPVVDDPTDKGPADDGPLGGGSMGEDSGGMSGAGGRGGPGAPGGLSLGVILGTPPTTRSNAKMVETT